MFIFQSKSLSLKTKYYDVPSEFKRQETPNTWRLYTANEHYELASTYPAFTYVPSEATDEMIKDCMKHRSKGRFPALTWYNKKNGAVIIRSAQPLPGMIVGVTGKNTSGDVEYLRLIDNITGKKKVHVLDSRPKLNAYTNKAAGGGYEDEVNYPFLTIEFENIDNIHVVRDRWVELYLKAYNW